jgi:hypothetical protein
MFYGTKELELRAMIDVARRSAHELVSLNSDFVNFSYKEILKEAGFMSKGGVINISALTQVCVQYFGVQFCRVTSFDDARIARTLRLDSQRASARHPFSAIAFQSLLSYVASGEGTFRPRIEQKSVTLNEPLICSGALHREGDSFGELRFVKASGRYITDCTCGMSVSVRADCEGKILSRLTVGYGRRYKAAFNSLVRGGMNALAAGREIGINKNIGYIWKREDLQEASQLSRSCRYVLRSKWRACVKSAPTNRRLSTAHQMEPNLWQKLRIHDREWFLRFNSYWDSRRRGDDRHSEILARLGDARKIVSGRLPPQQVTRKALVSVARAELNGRLRGCRSVAVRQHLSTLVEERSVFMDRLIDYWLKQLPGKRVVSIRQFSRHCGISYRMMTPAQRVRVAGCLQMLPR